jgi:hypothetical protein
MQNAWILQERPNASGGSGRKLQRTPETMNAFCKIVSHDLSGLWTRLLPNSGMKKSKPTRRLEPLEAGQIWEVAGMNLQVSLVGKLLVHYKLAKPGAVRIPNLVNGRATIEKYLKKNKAVLVKS